MAAALDFQTIEVPLGRIGLDQKSASRATPLGRMQRLENARFTKPGALTPRPGFDPLTQELANPSGTATSIAAGRGLASFNSELVLWDPARMYSYDAGTAKWIDKGPMISGKVEQAPVVRNVYGQTYQDGATHSSGLQMYAWEDTSGGVRYAVVDGTTGQTVVASTLVSTTARKPKTLAVGNFLVLWFLDVADPTVPLLKMALLPVASPTDTLAPVTMTGGAGSGFRQVNATTPAYDACIVPGAAKSLADSMYLVFNNASTLGGFTVCSFQNPALTDIRGITTATTAGANNYLVTVFPDISVAGPVVAVCSSDDTTIDVYAWSAFVVGDTQTSLFSGVVATGIANGVALTGCSIDPLVAGSWRVGLATWDPTAATYNALTQIASSTAYTFGALASLLRSVSFAAKCFPFNGRAYFPLAYTSPLASTYFLADESGNLVMRCLAGIAGTAAVAIASARASFTSTITYSGPGATYVELGIGASGLVHAAGSSAVEMATNLVSAWAADSTAAAIATVTRNGAIITATAVAPGTPGNALEVVTIWTAGSGWDPPAAGGTLTGGVGSPYGGVLPEVTPVDWDGPTETTAAVSATDAITVAAGSGTQTATIGGFDVSVTWTTSAANTATLLRAAIKADAFAGPLVTVGGTGTAVSLTATAGGTQGNLLALAVTGNALTRTSAFFTGGTDPTFDADSYDWNEVRWAGLVRDFLTTFPGTTTTGTSTTATFTQTGVTALSWTFYSQTESYIRAALGQSLNIGGGFLAQYDGVKPVELGFHVFPELTTSNIVTADAGGALGNALATSYWWVVTYSWPDAQGIEHESEPSVPIEKTFNAGVTTGLATLTLPTLRLTAKSGASPVTLKVYRTIGTSPGIFYLASATVVPAASPATNAPVLNDMTVDTVTFIDAMSDAAIIGNPRLYTTGGVLENTAPPPCVAFTVFQNRLVGISSENPLVGFFSQQVTPGTSVNFSDFLTLSLDPRIGGATAVAVEDEKLVFTGTDTCWYVTGQGPDATGALSTYQDPQLVPGESVGCTNPKSMVLGDQGLVFQSAKGLYLLTRDLRIVYIGAEVEDLVNDAVVTSAHSIPTATQFRVTIDSGSAAVFDSLVGQWEVDIPVAAVDSALWNGVFAYLQDDGLVLTESADFSDAGRVINMALRTGPIRVGAVAGYQRVKEIVVLGTYESPHDLEVSLMFDGNPSTVQTEVVTPLTRDTWGSDATWGSGEVWGGRFQPYIWRIRPNFEQCESIQIVVRTVPTGTGEGCTLSALNLTVAVKKGAYKAAATSTFGG